MRCSLRRCGSGNLGVEGRRTLHVEGFFDLDDVETEAFEREVSFRALAGDQFHIERYRFVFVDY